MAGEVGDFGYRNCRSVKIIGIFSVIIFIFSFVLQASLACNEAVCASIVSKCMLTQSCKCDKKNISCSRDCYHCLDYLYLECCSCVEMCPKANETDTHLGQKSHVEDLQEPIPELFNVLTEEKDRLLRWTSYSYPSHVTIVSQDKEIKFSAVPLTSAEAKGKDVSKEEELSTNCTVAYMSQCMSWNKCKSSCRSMGSSSYRWFHDGCCECVGSSCLNYGINESRCLECPPFQEEMTIEENDGVIVDNPQKPANTQDDYENYDEEEETEDAEKKVKDEGSLQNVDFT